MRFLEKSTLTPIWLSPIRNFDPNDFTSDQSKSNCLSKRNALVRWIRRFWMLIRKKITDLFDPKISGFFHRIMTSPGPKNVRRIWVFVVCQPWLRPTNEPEIQWYNYLKWSGHFRLLQTRFGNSARPSWESQRSYNESPSIFKFLHKTTEDEISRRDNTLF